MTDEQVWSDIQKFITYLEANGVSTNYLVLKATATGDSSKRYTHIGEGVSVTSFASSLARGIVFATKNWGAE